MLPITLALGRELALAPGAFDAVEAADQRVLQRSRSVDEP
jgi:hypothetical protein